MKNSKIEWKNMVLMFWVLIINNSRNRGTAEICAPTYKDCFKKDFALHPPDLLKKNAEKCTATQISEKKHSFVENKPSFAPPFFC